MGNLRGLGDPLKLDPHKAMLKKSKRLAKKMYKKSGDTSSKRIKKKFIDPEAEETFDYGGKMFSAEAWAAD